MDSYLSDHNRNARSLLQAFRASKNFDYLKEAFERFPDDPMVLLHHAVYRSAPTEERKAALNKLQELLPDDAVPCYLLGEQLLQEGDLDGALELLLAGALRPHAYNYANELIADSQEFLEASGVPADDALPQAFFNLEMRLLTPMRNLLGLVQDIHADLSTEEGGEEFAEKWAIAGSHLARRMQSQIGQTLIELLTGISVERQFLSLLSPETELVADGTTVAQRTSEIEELRALIRSFHLMSDAALALPPDEKRFFFKKAQEEGEISALLWLNGQDR